MPLKHGKQPARFDPRDLRFEDYVHDKLTLDVPVRFGHYGLVPKYDMLGNGPDDSVAPGFQGAGDCVWAGADHETQMLNAAAGRVVQFTGVNAVGDYSAVTGYKVGDDSTDHGTDVRTALNYRRDVGVADTAGSRHKIAGYAALRLGDWDSLRQAVYLFGAVAIGIRVPSSFMSQFNAGQVFDVVAGATDTGEGHYMPVLGVDGDTLDLPNWGRVCQMTRAFWEAQTDESYCIFSQEMLTNDRSLEGFNTTQLAADLAAIGA